MDSFLTTYRKDYTSKKSSKFTRPKSFDRQEFRDPIGEGFKQFLKLRGKVSSLDTYEEYHDDYLEKFKKLYPQLGKKYFNAPVNVPMVEQNYEMNEHTIYQEDYCDLEKDRQYTEDMKKKQILELPDDWDLPSTSYLTSYRDPKLLNPKALEVVERIGAKHNLTTNAHLNKVLGIKTGESEYQSVISGLGDVIVNDQIHGKIVHPKCTCTKHHPEQE